MKFDIYIHGVPNGQRIWSTGGDDPIIKQFYGTGNEEETKFLVEVRQSGGQNYCYYSLLKYKNISAESGRAGSYFGITIRMDMVCTQIKTIFQLLEVIYNNAILIKFLKQDGERLRFVVNDFKENQSLCKSIVDKIVVFLGQSVEGTDFTNITTDMVNSKGTAKVHVTEYSSDRALAVILKGGGIAVSTDYPSSQLTSYIAKKDSEVNNLKLQAQQEISRIQQQAKMEIEHIKANYSAMDKKLATYEQKLRQLTSENNGLQNEIAHLHQGITERDKTITKLKTSSPHGQAPSKNNCPTNVLTSVILPFVNLLIVIVVLIVLFWRIPSDNTKTINEISNNITELKEKMDSFTVDTVPAKKTILSTNP